MAAPRRLNSRDFQIFMAGYNYMVVEIFKEAGMAVNKLSDMTMLLHSMSESQLGGRWTDEEIVMLGLCVHRFVVDIIKLCQHVKNRRVTQIRATLKKAFEDAGIPVRPVSSTVTSPDQPPPSPQVTLNASENEVDVDGFTADVTLEFEPLN